MPKVTEEYVKQKRAGILDAALAVFKNKPLYDITMLDVIKEAELSRGGIYRYYKNIDDLLVEMINRESKKQSYRADIDVILKLNRVEIIESLLIVLGRHLDQSVAIIGKIQMELTLLVATQPDRARRITSRLIEQENGQYLMRSLFKVVEEGLASGDFKSSDTIEDIINFVQIYIEGLIKIKVLNKCYDVGNHVDAERMMRLLVQALFELLGVRRDT